MYVCRARFHFVDASGWRNRARVLANCPTARRHTSLKLPKKNKSTTHYQENERETDNRNHVRFSFSNFLTGAQSSVKLMLLLSVEFIDFFVEHWSSDDRLLLQSLSPQISVVARSTNFPDRIWHSSRDLSRVIEEEWQICNCCSYSILLPFPPCREFPIENHRQIRIESELLFCFRCWRRRSGVQRTVRMTQEPSAPSYKSQHSPFTQSSSEQTVVDSMKSLLNSGIAARIELYWPRCAAAAEWERMFAVLFVFITNHK